MHDLFIPYIFAIFFVCVILRLVYKKTRSKKSNETFNPDTWIKYNFMDLEKRPKQSGKYFVHRKDGKMHWETWNGSGFAYNDNSITYFRNILPPPNC